MVAIVVRVDDGPSFAATPDRGEVSIGRRDGSAIRIDDPAISRTHATLTWRAGAWWLCDQSQNGTLLNGRAVELDRRVEAGDRIELRGDVDHRIEIISMGTGDGETKTRCIVRSFVHAGGEGVARIGTTRRKNLIVAPITERPGRLLRALIEAEISGVALLPEREAELLGGRSKDNAYQARKDLREWWAALCADFTELDEATRQRGRNAAPDIVEQDRRGGPLRLAIDAARFALE